METTIERHTTANTRKKAANEAAHSDGSWGIVLAYDRTRIASDEETINPCAGGHTPNAATMRTIRDTDAGIGVSEPYNNLDDLWKDCLGDGWRDYFHGKEHHAVQA